MKQLNKDKKESKYTADQLNQHIYECIQSSVDCGNCQRSETLFVESYLAQEDFFQKGWRATKNGNVYCPECAKKKLKQ